MRIPTPAADVDERDLETHFGLDEFGNLTKRLAE
jgi:hypothetical protein